MIGSEDIQKTRGWLCTRRELKAMQRTAKRTKKAWAPIPSARPWAEHVEQLLLMLSRLAPDTAEQGPFQVQDTTGHPNTSSESAEIQGTRRGDWANFRGWFPLFPTAAICLRSGSKTLPNKRGSTGALGNMLPRINLYGGVEFQASYSTSIVPALTRLLCSSWGQ